MEPNPLPNPQAEERVCVRCGATIAPNAAEGWCTRCLLATATAATEVPGLARGGIQAPDLDSVRAAFPSLDQLELVGTGGMGAVYRARQPKLDRWIALKLLPAELGKDPTFAERFLREARVLARLSHPNIVSVHDFGQSGDFCYLLMEYVDGANLRQAMRAGRFTAAQALALVPQICSALQFAHDHGVMHRDIKPENILLDSQGRVKLADFGIAKLITEPVGAPSLTVTGATVGTPQYMAPEQIERPSEVDHRADIYSLGVVFYELLTGELPLGRFAAPSSKTPVDARVDDIVFRALAKERELRQQSANEMRSAVELVGNACASGEKRRIEAGVQPAQPPQALEQGSQALLDAPSQRPVRTQFAPLWEMPTSYRAWVLVTLWIWLFLSLPGMLANLSLLQKLLWPVDFGGSAARGFPHPNALGVLAGLAVCAVAASRVFPRTDLWLSPIRLRPAVPAEGLDRGLWLGLFAAILYFGLDATLHTVFAILGLVNTTLQELSAFKISTAFLIGCIYPIVLARAWRQGKEAEASVQGPVAASMPAWGMKAAVALMVLSTGTLLIGRFQLPKAVGDAPPAVPISWVGGFLLFCLAWWTRSRFWHGAARVLCAFTTYVNFAGCVFLVLWRFSGASNAAVPEPASEASAPMRSDMVWVLVSVVGMTLVELAVWLSLYHRSTQAAFGLSPKSRTAASPSTDPAARTA